MDEKTAAELRKALNYLRAGKTKDARPLIVQILKTNPEVDQAWYMLSFVVSDRSKQIYALQQVLSLNPNHAKAKSKMAKVLSSAKDEGDDVKSSAQPTTESILGEAPLAAPEPDEDDWQSRLSSPKTEPLKPAPPPPPLPVAEPIEVEPVEEEPEEEPVIGGITSDTFGSYKGPKKNFLKPIRKFLIWVIVLGGLGYGVIKGIEIIPGILDQFVNTQPADGDGELPDLPTPTPTDRGGRLLPPTWTPPPSPLPSSTPGPTGTATATEIPTS